MRTDQNWTYFKFSHCENIRQPNIKVIVYRLQVHENRPKLKTDFFLLHETLMDV